MKPITDLLFIGAGPSTIFAVLRLIRGGYRGSITIVEKGNSIEDRRPSEVINGFAGAGCYSDSKLSSALDVGGSIPGLTEEKLNEYNKYLLSELNGFKDKACSFYHTPYYPDLEWDSIKDYNTKNSTLKWNTHNTLHIGTDRGRAIYFMIENFLESQPNIKILFNSEVINVITYPSPHYEPQNFLVFIKSKNKNENNKTKEISIITNKLILAVGQKSLLPEKTIKAFELKSKPRAMQLGIRVVDTINDQYRNIIKANYDFKFTKEYKYKDVTVRVRTFCCNSGNAHVCAEKTGDGFVCFNGHAFKKEDPNNQSVNYGIMCEVEGLSQYNTKEEQIELMKNINKISTWEDDNISNIETGIEPIAKRKLLDGFPQLEGIYPEEILLSLKDFIRELGKLVDLSRAHYLYPEVKLSGESPDINYSTFETDHKNLYMIGDCVCSRGIVKAGYTGFSFAESLLGEK